MLAGLMPRSTMLRACAAVDATLSLLFSLLASHTRTSCLCVLLCEKAHAGFLPDPEEDSCPIRACCSSIARRCRKGAVVLCR